ncbi:MAG: putative phage tail protein [Pseudomonadota bacterium]|jgi:uncharacterized protein YmfQ (DUF2313 family)|uniref:putative phage tail protein n=1 Tax=unclassified Sphingomonas TaxID=196159 RepID=UPI0010F652EA|nr:putative phage tail protein [Sphingomonas sp. 3F27F9]
MRAEPDTLDGGGGGDPGSPITTPDPAPNPTPTPVSTPPASPAATPAPPSRPPPVPLPALPKPQLPAPPAPVGVARYSEDDYTDVALSLRPRGRVWSLDPNGVQARVFRGVAKTLVALDAAANSILAGSLPGSSLSGFIPEWEATLGLPDPCAGDAPTVQQRCDQIRARFVGGGGQSRQHYLDMAKTLGFTITITNFSPFRVGHSSINEPINDERWTFIWGVTIVSNFGGAPIDVLLCELAAGRPAGTDIILLS